MIGMVFKINISDKGKAWRIESENSLLVGKSVGEVIKGEEIKPELSGYELEITGGSDNAGFPLFDEVEGVYLKKVLLTKGFGMKKAKPHGLRKRKTVRGKVISEAVTLVNMKVLKAGSKKLEEVFPEQNKPKVEEKKEEVKAVAVPAA